MMELEIEDKEGITEFYLFKMAHIWTIYPYTLRK